MEQILHAPIFRLPGIPDHVTYTWLVMLILLGFFIAATRSLQLVPSGLQNFAEVLVERFLVLLDDVIGHEGRRYFPLVATLGLFILTANLLGLVPGMETPTANLNTTAACALVVFCTYHWIGIRKQGLVTYLNHLTGPMPWSFGMAPIKLLMFPIEVVSHLARPLSLSLRLFGNMTGGHILLGVIFFLVGLDHGLLGWALSGSLGGIVLGGLGSIVMTVFTVGFLIPLKILVAFLQAFIFVMLTMLYIAGALEEAEHPAEHH